MSMLYRECCEQVGFNEIRWHLGFDFNQELAYPDLDEANWIYAVCASK